MPRSAFPPARYLAPLCHQKWATEEILPRITEVPILFLSGLKDEIIPYVKRSLVPLSVYAKQISGRPSHMKLLRSVCRSKSVTWRELPNGTHNESVGEPGYFSYIIDFINKTTG